MNMKFDMKINAEENGKPVSIECSRVQVEMEFPGMIGSPTGLQAIFHQLTDEQIMQLMVLVSEASFTPEEWDELNRLVKDSSLTKKPEELENLLRLVKDSSLTKKPEEFAATIRLVKDSSLTKKPEDINGFKQLVKDSSLTKPVDIETIKGLVKDSSLTLRSGKAQDVLIEERVTLFQFVKMVLIAKIVMREIDQATGEY